MPYNKELDRVYGPVSTFVNETFEDIIIEGPKIDFGLFRKNPTMFVSTHRSHVDYFLVGYFLYQNGIRNMRFAAGDNLTNFPYIGKKFKKLGAFSVERGKSFNRRYVRDLCARVTEMLLSGENIIVFPESGRSYSGTMLEAKGGVIASQVIAQHKNRDGTHYFFPIAISYEKLPELKWFELLLKGKEYKQSKNVFKRLTGSLFYYGSDLLAFAKFISARRFKKHYGRVYIDYGNPFTAQEVTDIYKNYTETGRDEMSRNRTSIQDISSHIHSVFISLYRILPAHVVAGIIGIKKIVSIREINENVPFILDKLKKLNMNCRTLNSLSPQQITDQGINRLVDLNSVKKTGDRLYIKKPSVIQYYAASISDTAKGDK